MRRILVPCILLILLTAVWVAPAARAASGPSPADWSPLSTLAEVWHTLTAFWSHLGPESDPAGLLATSPDSWRPAAVGEVISSSALDKAGPEFDPNGAPATSGEVLEPAGPMFDPGGTASPSS